MHYPKAIPLDRHDGIFAFRLRKTREITGQIHIELSSERSRLISKLFEIPQMPATQSEPRRRQFTQRRAPARRHVHGHVEAHSQRRCEARGGWSRADETEFLVKA